MDFIHIWPAGRYRSKSFYQHHPHPEGWPWDQGHRLRLHKKVKIFVFKFNSYIMKTLWGISLIFDILVDIQYSQRDIPIHLGRHHDHFFRHHFFRHGVASSCHRDERDSWRDAQVFSARHCSDTLSETLIRPRILLPFKETQRVTARHFWP